MAREGATLAPFASTAFQRCDTQGTHLPMDFSLGIKPLAAYDDGQCISLSLLRQGLGSWLGPPAVKAPHVLWGFEEA